MREAAYYEKLPHHMVRCRLCGHECRLRPGATGICHVRRNVNGTLAAENYGQVVALAMDRIEKKPLYHYYPGSSILSAASFGCNFACPFCQNYDISQSRRAARYLSPKDMTALAGEHGSIGIAYTYSEPMMWFEYILDVAALARKQGLKNVLVSNGDINERPLQDLLPLLDAVNLDIKSMDHGFYRTTCKGSLDNVLRTARALHRAGVHLEITNLVIPSLNDSDDLLQALIDFIAQELAPWVPLHFSRYFPHYKMSLPPTPEATLEHAFRLAREKLQHVFVGNVMFHKQWQNSICPQCGETLVDRSISAPSGIKLQEGRCPNCRARAHIIQ